ncbi:unnamed protein product [Lathyrus sativus]|nr:unnamed protein product [Lathyrus sativus]
MSRTPNYIVHAHYDGETFISENSGFGFQNTDLTRLTMSRKANFVHFKERIQSKILSGQISQIIYRSPVFFDNNQVKYFQEKIQDNNDVDQMFDSHEHSGFDYIEVYLLLCQTEHEVGETTDIDEIDVVDEEEEDPEAMVDQMVNLFETGDYNAMTPLQDIDEEALPLNQVYCPPQHMTNLQFSGDDTSSYYFYNPSQQIESVLKVGNQYRTKEECIKAIRKFHMDNFVDFYINRNDSKRYVVVCRSAICKFRLAASYRKRSDCWEICSTDPPHSCTTNINRQDHGKLSSQLISQEILHLVGADPSVKVSTIISHVVARFNYTPSYRKAWIGRIKAVEHVYGNWEHSYHQLPQYLLALQKYVPGTVVILESLPAYTPEGTCVAGSRIFSRLFWAFQPCIKGFAFCKPVIQVDGTWLYGKYKGTLLMAVAQDGNNNIFSIAFALVEGETGEAWSFFLRNLRTHVAPQPNLCLISDKHASIVSAYNNPANGWHNPSSVHVFCIRHIAQNFMWEIKDRNLRKKVVNAGYALNQPSFMYYREEIRLSSAEALRWVDNIPVEKWTRSFDGGCRWGHMATNLVESLNGVFKGTRNLPITALVRATYYRLGSLFAARGKKWSVVLQPGQIFSESSMKYMRDETSKAASHRVRPFDRHDYSFIVDETMDHNEGRPMGHYRVELHKNWCDCGKFQTFRMPCSHVIAACSTARQDPFLQLSEVYKVVNLFGIYSSSFPVVASEDYWPTYHGDTIYHNENMRRNKKGRPKSTRITTEMDTAEKMERLCGICCLPGHTRKNCPNVGTSSR